MRWLLILAGFGLVGVFTPPAMAQTDADAQAFAERFLPEVRAALPNETISPTHDDPLQLNVAQPDDSDGLVSISLHGVFGICQTRPISQCDAEKARLIRLLKAEPTTASKDNLRLLVRNSGQWAWIQESLKESESLPLHQQIGEDLYSILAFDICQDSSACISPNVYRLRQGKWVIAKQEDGLN